MVTPLSNTTLPAVDVDLTVTGTNRAPFTVPPTASSRIRYDPSGHPLVVTVIAGSHFVVTVFTCACTEAGGCTFPGVTGDFHTCRACVPP